MSFKKTDNKLTFTLIQVADLKLHFNSMKFTIPDKKNQMYFYLEL